MKLAVMQPYFFPYLGYFDLINYSDKFIVLDTVQYIDRGWMNRNRILEPNKTWQYIGLPLKKHAQKIKITDVRISDEQPWLERIIAQTLCYRKFAPHYFAIKQLLEECLNFDVQYLSEFNVHCLVLICEYLDIQFEFEFFSKMDFEIDTVDKPSDWALNISQELLADEYVNLPGGKAIYDTNGFGAKGIKLNLRQVPTFKYKTYPFNFIPNLSIIDVLMWNSPEEVKSFLSYLKKRDFNLITNENG